MFPGEAPCRHPCRRLRYGILPGSSLTGWFLPPDRVRLGVKSHPGGEEGGEGAPTDGEGDQQPHAQGQDSQEIDEDDQQEKSKEFEPVRSHPAPANCMASQKPAFRSRTNQGARKKPTAR